MFLQSYSVGIDISDHKLRAVQLRKRAGRTSITWFNEYTLPQGAIVDGSIQQSDIVVEGLRQVFKQSTLTLRQPDQFINIGVPEQHSFISTLPNENNGLSIEEQAHRAIPYNENEVYLDTVNNRQQRTFTVAASTKQFIDSYLSVLEDADIRPSGLFVEAVAMSQALMNTDNSSGASLIVDMGSARTTVILFMRGAIYFTTSYPSVIVNEQITEEHLLGVIQQITQYHADHYRDVEALERIILCGSGAHMLHITDELQTAVQIPMELGNPTAGMTENTVLGKMTLPLTFTTAIGLAQMKTT